MCKKPTNTDLRKYVAGQGKHGRVKGRKEAHPHRRRSTKGRKTTSMGKTAGMARRPRLVPTLAIHGTPSALSLQHVKKEKKGNFPISSNALIAARTVSRRSRGIEIQDIHTYHDKFFECLQMVTSYGHATHRWRRGH